MKFKRYFPLAFLISLFLFHCIFIICQRNLVDSDMSQEMLLAKHLLSSRQLVSKHWYYTSEIRVYNIHLFFGLGLLLFPNNCHMARIIGSVLIYMMYVFSIRQLLCACNRKNCWTKAATLCLLPASTIYWFLGLFGLGYIFYASNVLLILSLLVHNTRRSLLAACILSLFLGFNGIKMFLMLYGPMLAASCYVLYRKKEACFPLSKSSLFLIAANLAGMLVYKLAFNEYHFFRFADTRFIGSQWKNTLSISSIADKILGFLTLFGYQGGAKLFSFGYS